MAIMYATVGDTIRVQYEGKWYEFRVSVLAPLFVARDEPPVGFAPNMPEEVVMEELVGGPVMCEVCGENEAGDYETGTGHHVCPTCVNNGLAYRAAMYVMENIGEFDPQLARTLQVLDEDDVQMRTSHMPYVDSESAAMDMFRGSDAKGRFEMMHPILTTIVGALGEPGDMQGVEMRMEN